MVETGTNRIGQSFIQGHDVQPWNRPNRDLNLVFFGLHKCVKQLVQYRRIDISLSRDFQRQCPIAVATAHIYVVRDWQSRRTESVSPDSYRRIAPLPWQMPLGPTAAVRIRGRNRPEASTPKPAALREVENRLRPSARFRPLQL